MRQSWDEYFLSIARHVASRSKDLSTKVGAVAVGIDCEIRSTGYNGFPRGINDNLPSRHERPLKYQYSEHAERNLIYNAALVGVSMKGCTLYLSSYPAVLPPCSDCARAIIQSGIVRVVFEKAEIIERWKSQCEIAMSMLDEAQVEISELEITR